ncbi:MAG: diguanylate cyclase [Chloroflexi bacterium]|nr:diguanylate cyclase [Chloroflexota bacterium]
MEMRFYLRIIRRGWWLILISALVAVNFSLVYSYYITTPMYETVARFIVSPNVQNVTGRDLVNSLEALDKRSIISTYAEVLNSRQIIESTIKLLGDNPEDYQEYTMAVTVLPDANILRFSVRGPDPEVATMLANSIGQYAIDFIRKLYVVYDIDFLDKAVVPLEPYHPRPVQDAGLALLIGTVVGVSLAIFRDQLSSTLDRLSQRRMIDSESQAYTRTYFERRVREEFATHPESVFTLGFIFLNGIQEFYDSLPQAYVNRIMRRVTATLKDQLRGNDIVGKWSQLQFSVLLPSTDGVSAEHRLLRIQKVLNQQLSLDEDGEFNILLDPRIGLADRQGGESFNVLVDQVEQALEIAMESDDKIYLYKVRPFG